MEQNTAAAIDAELAALENSAEPSPVVVAQQEAANEAQHTAEQAHEKAVQEYAEVLQPVLHMGFAVLAPAWEVSPTEAEALSAAYAPLLQKYWPDATSRFGPEITAAVCTAAILAPRFGKPRKLDAAPVDAANDSDGDGAGVPSAQAPQKPGDDVQVTGEVPE